MAAGEGTEGESEPRVVLGQQLGGTGVESGRGSGKTDGSTSLVNSELFGELAGHKEEEGQVEEEEEGDQGDVDPQGRQAARGAIRCASKNRPWGYSGTYRKRKVMMNQAAKKIPMALVSCPG